MSRQRTTRQKPEVIDRSLNIKASKFPQILPKTENQKYFVEAFGESKIVIGAGFAGSGKTLLSIYHAAKQLYHGKTKKIILLRAYQPLAGRTIGFLPGEAEDKLLPYYRQMLDYLEDILGKAQVEIHRKRGAIEICSLETIRGRNWEDAVVIVDEAQNLFAEEVRALCTRLGDNSQMILLGDDSGVQTDITNETDGLSYLLGIVEKYNIPDLALVYFEVQDILRSNITKDFVIAFDKELQEQRQRTRQQTRRTA